MGRWYLGLGTTVLKTKPKTTKQLLDPVEFPQAFIDQICKTTLQVLFSRKTFSQSMPHAPPILRSIIPIGNKLAPSAQATKMLNSKIAICLTTLALIAFVFCTNMNSGVPLPILFYISFLMLITILLVNKIEEKKFITSTTYRRNYLHRFVYRVSVSVSLLLLASFTLLSYKLEETSLLLTMVLVCFSFWNFKSPNYKQPFRGTNSLSNYWRRITGKATLSQLNYEPGNKIFFSYEDGLTRNDCNRYHVFLNRVKESCVESSITDFAWYRKTLWSTRQQTSPNELSKGLEFTIPKGIEKKLIPHLYHLLYWEVVIQEIDGPFMERFLARVEQVAIKN